jgi:glycosyltransferase involved in cell wall biosynthesis
LCKLQGISILNRLLPRILIVVPAFYPARTGYANACLNFINAIDSERFDVHLLSYVNAELPESLAHVKLYVIEPWSGGLKPELVREMLPGRWDALIIESFENSNFNSVLIDNLDVNNSNIAVRVHATTETEVFTSGMTEYYECMLEHALAISRNIKNIWSTTKTYISYYKQHYLKDDIQRAAICYHWLPNLPQPDNYRRYSDERLRYCQMNHGGLKEIVLLGRLSEQGVNQKNIGNLLRGLYLLRSRDDGCLANIRIHLIGDGECRDAVLRQIEKFELTDLFHPHLTLTHGETLDLLVRAHASVLISKYEGHSMFGLENLCVGVPLLTSDRGGMSEFVKHGVNGICVDPEDIYDIANGFRSILKMHPDGFDRGVYLSEYSYEALSVRVNDLVALLVAEI